MEKVYNLDLGVKFVVVGAGDKTVYLVYLKEGTDVADLKQDIMPRVQKDYRGYTIVYRPADGGEWKEMRYDQRDTHYDPAWHGSHCPKDADIDYTLRELGLQG